MAMELFGPKIAPYAAVACVVSFLISGHRSVYPSQVLSIRKSSSVIVETGKAVEGLKVHVEPRKKSISANIFRMARVVIKILYKKE